MNKQELIEEIKKRGRLYPDIFGNKIECISVNDVIELIEQLDEPQKVTIPQFVADWIEYNKIAGNTLYRALNDAYDEVSIWFWEDKLNRQEIFARAWLDGFDIEKEKRYTVVMEATKQPLYYNAGDKKLFFSLGRLATKFTRKELEESGFSWVFSCEGVEIKEVEE